MQLAVSQIDDGGFDPASLVFALEGLLIIDRSGISQALIDRVAEVLGATPAPYWRPVKPLAATPQGLVLLPQSVEVASSFLRICQLTDSNSVDSLFGRCLDMLKGYTAWLESRAVRGSYPNRGKERRFEGWQSEHTAAPSKIHLWATSQVLLYLQYYAAMLDQHIARALRADVGLAYTQVKATDPEKRKRTWKEVMLREPLAGFHPTKYRVYDEMDQYFVEPRAVKAQNADLSYSMLLYGPPGTGKTMLAQELANALGYDFIGVSPSDFIQSGEAGVEARAKRIMEVLNAQSDVVILLDEIDRLLLDRNSEQYGLQSDMFQFMTPSMLTKLHDLREMKRSVFVIATNYAERIDSAIKRPGRIDRQLLVLPPTTLRESGLSRFGWPIGRRRGSLLGSSRRRRSTRWRGGPLYSCSTN